MSTSQAAQVADLLTDYSIEVLPRHAADIGSIASTLPAGTRVYIAQTERTSHEEIVHAAEEFIGAGYCVMPHLPARLVRDERTLLAILDRYRQVGVNELLLIAGGGAAPMGVFDNSMQLLETGFFQASGFRRIHVAGHPEGNPASDRSGSNLVSDGALLWKQRFSRQTGISMGIVTQFMFDPETAKHWDERLRVLGITMPVFLGVPGPTKLTTLVKYAIACGVGPSLSVLQRRAADVTRLLKPYEPTDFIAAIARHKRETPESLIRGLHFFAFGGVGKTAEWAEAKRLAEL